MKRFHRPVTLLIAVVFVTALSGCPRRPVAGETRTFDGIEFQWCPPGSFTMGSPANENDHSANEAQHVVNLSRGFWLSKYEITQAQWQGIMGNNPSLFDDAGNENNPVDQVTWDDAQNFLAALNASASGGTYRLPTESEWEYAYRAGTTTRFYWGEDVIELAIHDNTWFFGNSGNTTHPVGEKIPNPWGLYDMGGNVYEWCHDLIGDYPAGPVTDPQGAASGTNRVVRGGAHDTRSASIRAASRFSFNPMSSYNGIGFRLLRTQN